MTSTVRTTPTMPLRQTASPLRLCEQGRTVSVRWPCWWPCMGAIKRLLEANRDIISRIDEIAFSNELAGSQRGCGGARLGERDAALRWCGPLRSGHLASRSSEAAKDSRPLIHTGRTRWPGDGFHQAGGRIRQAAVLASYRVWRVTKGDGIDGGNRHSSRSRLMQSSQVNRLSR